MAVKNRILITVFTDPMMGLSARIPDPVWRICAAHTELQESGL